MNVITIQNDGKVVVPDEDKVIGRVGEIAANTLQFTYPLIDGCEYRLTFVSIYGTYSVPLVGTEYEVDSDLLATQQAICCVWSAVKAKGQFYEQVKKSDIFVLQVNPSLSDTPAPVPPYQIAVDMYNRLENALNHPSYVGDNGNWYNYDPTTDVFIDSGISAVGMQGDKGDTGLPGKDGQDGFSPSAKAEETDYGALITIKDKDGVSSAVIKTGTTIYEAKRLANHASLYLVADLDFSKLIKGKIYYFRFTQNSLSGVQLIDKNDQVVSIPQGISYVPMVLGAMYNSNGGFDVLGYRPSNLTTVTRKASNSIYTSVPFSNFDLSDDIDITLYNTLGISDWGNTSTLVTQRCDFKVQINTQETAYNVKWFDNIKWISGKPPVFTPNQTRVFHFWSLDGKNWCGLDETAHLEKSPLTTTQLPENNILVPQTEYYLGTKETVTIQLPQNAELGQECYVTFNSGSTPTVLEVNTTNTTPLTLVPSANFVCEISAKWNGSLWVLLTSEVEA